MPRHQLTDAEWALIEPFFPVRENRVGRPSLDTRTVVNAIFWILVAGTPWRDLPSEYGSWETIYGRFNKWRKDESFNRAMLELQRALHEKGLIDNNFWCVDGTNARAARAAAGAPKKRVWPENRKITRSATAGAAMEANCIL